MKLCDGAEMTIFWRPVFAASRVQRISDLHSKFALRPHHVPKYGKHPMLGVTLCDTLHFDVHVGNVLKMCSQRVSSKTPSRPGPSTPSAEHCIRCTSVIQITVCCSCLEWIYVS